MTKQEVGESLIQIGTFMLLLPLLISIIVSGLYAISVINFTTTTLLVFGCLIYFGISFGLIVTGKRMLK